MKALKDLSEVEYGTLKISNQLFILYPEATGDYEIDTMGDVIGKEFKNDIEK